jgi:acyl dehydratase
MSRTAIPLLDAASLRGWHGHHVHRPSAAVLSAYAHATDDIRAERQLGSIASPTYAFVPFSHCLFPLLDQVLGKDGRVRVIHLAHDFAFHAPIRAGHDIEVRSELLALRAGPLGAVVEFRAVTVDGHGDPVNEQRAELLIRDTGLTDPIGDGTPEPGRSNATYGEHDGRAALTITDGLTGTYAAASGDDGPLHVDPAAARRHGYASVVVQGMCTLAMACHAIEKTRTGPEFLVTALGVRFVRPVHQGDRLDVRFGEASGRSFRFEVTNRRRRTVLRNGYVVLGSEVPGSAS